MTTTKIYKSIPPEKLLEEINDVFLKTIAASYIQAAEKAIDDGHKDNYLRFKARLKTRNLNFGICWYCLKTFNTEIGNHPKVEEHTIGKHDPETHWSRSYWHPSPHESTTKKKLVEMLQARIEILEEWL